MSWLSCFLNVPHTFFLVQLLEKQDLRVITYDFTCLCWSFSIKDLQRHTSLSDNVGELVCSRIGQLPKEVQEILKLASCFGARVDMKVLEITKLVASEPIEDIRSCLDQACKEQMLIQISETEFEFAHDKIQSAAFSFASIWRWSSTLLEDERLTFTCADQLQQALEFVETTNDRVRIAKLSFVARNLAAAMSAFVPASAYFEMGIKCLGGKDAFEKHYDLSMHQLHTLLSNTEYCAGHILWSKETAETVVNHAKTENKKILPWLTVFSCL
jgi:predicted ATPase